MSKGSNRRPENSEKFATNWDAIFGKKNKESVPVKQHEEEIAKAVSKMWEYIGHDNHKNEDWYKCSICKDSDWIPTYGTLDQLSCKCK